MRSGLIGLWAVGVQRRGHPAHEEGLRVRVLAAQDGVDADHVALPLERLQVVRDGEQVLLGRAAGRPGGPSSRCAKSESWPRVGQPLQARAHVARSTSRSPSASPTATEPGAPCVAGLGLQRRDDVHPVERVQVVEVDDVVVDELAARDQVAHELGVGRRRGADRVLDGPHRGDGVHRRADAADPLGPDPGLAGVLALEDRLDPAEHRRRPPTPRRPCRPARRASMRRWPSMRVTGSILTFGTVARRSSAGAGCGLLAAAASFAGSARLRRPARRVAACTILAAPRARRRRGDRADDREPDRSRPSCRRRSPARSAAARRTGSSCSQKSGDAQRDAVVPRLDRPARAVVPARRWGSCSSRGALAAHLVEAVALAVRPRRPTPPRTGRRRSRRAARTGRG